MLSAIAVSRLLQHPSIDETRLGLISHLTPSLQVLIPSLTSLQSPVDWHMMLPFFRAPTSYMRLPLSRVSTSFRVLVSCSHLQITQISHMLLLLVLSIPDLLSQLFDFIQIIMVEMAVIVSIMIQILLKPLLKIILLSFIVYL